MASEGTAKSTGGSRDITRLLTAAAAGQSKAASQLAPLVYAELHRLARHYMRGERPGHSLQATLLVDEAYLRLVGGQATWQNRAQFFGTAAQCMRRILVDHARRRHAQKRAGLEHGVDVETVPSLTGENPERLLALDRALNQLEERSSRQRQIVEMRYFAGMNEQEIADVLEVSLRTVKRDWSVAKAWLYLELSK